MCSVVGYVGKQRCGAYIIEALKRLEYRGYDSVGMSLCVKGVLQSFKATEGLGALEQSWHASGFDGYAGIGHTRWATHGSATLENAHPHTNADGSIALVHNGIFENYRIHKEQLVSSGHRFYSDTDTEVLAHLVGDHVVKNGFACLSELLSHIEGSFACVVVRADSPEELLVIRKGSPVCIGIGDGEMFIASDVLAFADRVNEVIYVPEESYCRVTSTDCRIYRFDDSEYLYETHTVDARWFAASKGDYSHFMAKEIFEQREVIYRTVHHLRKANLTDFLPYFGNAQTIQGIGCGTSWHALSLAAWFFAEHARIPFNALQASEFRYGYVFPNPGLCSLFLSQSGETADTLEALRLAKSYDMQTFAVTNVSTSSIVREADYAVLTQAQQEIAVAATKSFTAQAVTLYWLAYVAAVSNSIQSYEDIFQVEEMLLRVAEHFDTQLHRYRSMIEDVVAPYLAQYTRFVCVGRQMSLPLAQEAALKLKEISYCFVDCYPAGELKHGGLALIDETVPTFLFSVRDSLIYQKLIGNAQEIKARKGILIIFAFEGQDELIAMADHVFIFPMGDVSAYQLTMIGVMQFLTYQIAKELGCSIDKPRNLAKSVTVE